MSDIFREVEEDVRRDRLEQLWKQYGAYLMTLVVLLLLAVAGYQFWQRYENGQLEKDSAQFLAAQRISNPADAAKAFAALSQTGHRGYATLAKLEQANALLLAGKRDDAVTIYKAIAASDSGSVGAVARLRAAWALVDSAPRDQLQSLLQPLLDPASAWKQMAQEVLAYNDYRNGKMLVASGEFGQIAADPQTPDALRSRARAFTQFLAGGGANDYGAVPPPAPPPAPGTPPDPTTGTAAAP